MLKMVSGDILMSNAQMIAQGVAPEDHFNQRLALSLRELYPSMAKDFRHYCKVSHPKPGEVWLWAGADGRRIANLMTQEPAPSQQGHPGKASSRNVNQALRNLRTLIEKEGIESVALQRLATGVGGMDWDEVLGLIENHLSDLDIPVYVYELYQPDVKAEE
jgi:O-acetyl-ADP-ribose deacetylase (regulator of RNase III)